MKRHSTLIPVSRLHHDMLVLAQLLKSDVPDYRALPTGIHGKRDYALGIYRKSIIPYLQDFGKRIYPYLEKLNFSNTQLLIDCVSKDQEMVNYFEKLYFSEDVDESMLNDTGLCIESTVRLKERQLFQQMQELLSEEELVAIPIKSISN